MWIWLFTQACALYVRKQRSVFMLLHGYNKWQTPWWYACIYHSDGPIWVQLNSLSLMRIHYISIISVFSPRPRCKGSEEHSEEQRLTRRHAILLDWLIFWIQIKESETKNSKKKLFQEEMDWRWVLVSTLCTNKLIISLIAASTIHPSSCYYQCVWW